MKVDPARQSVFLLHGILQQRQSAADERQARIDAILAAGGRLCELRWCASAGQHEQHDVDPPDRPAA